ncbi:MAG TPA: glycosyltransferase family 4 protein [Methylomirabilota bacterium]|jgi:glycosyltransferase involved in cell wall biosynthesis
MNIGLLSEALPYLPSVGGFRLYGANLIRCLGARHQIDLVTLLPGDDDEHLDWARQHCRSVQTIPLGPRPLLPRVANLASTYGRGRALHPRREVASALAHGLRKGAWDVLHVEGTYAAALMGDSLPIPKILSAHDSRSLRAVEMRRCATTWKEKSYYRLRGLVDPRFERLVYPRFDRCVFVAPRDVEAAREAGPGVRTALIPNGVDAEHFHPMDVPKEPASLVFHGHLGYLPNVDAVITFADTTFPLIQRRVPAAVFHVIGAEPHPRVRALQTRPGIRLSANLPDLRAAVCSASVYVCLLRHGTGIKNKLLEAMAMGLPVVAHPSALEGIDGTDGTHMLAAAEPVPFAEHVVRLIQEGDLSTRLAAAGRRLVEERYGWASRAREFEQLYEDAIRERNGKPVGSAARP